MKRIPLVLLLSMVRAYQWLVSPLCGTRCRYLPTCSHYAEEAVRVHGFRHGALLAVKRLLRCHPWGGEGFDPVPAQQVKTNDKR